jgi:hypothetical protein
MKDHLFGVRLDYVEAATVGRDHRRENFLNHCEDFVLHSVLHQACVESTTGLDPARKIPLGCARERTARRYGSRNARSPVARFAEADDLLRALLARGSKGPGLPKTEPNTVSRGGIERGPAQPEIWKRPVPVLPK